MMDRRLERQTAMGIQRDQTGNIREGGGQGSKLQKAKKTDKRPVPLGKTEAEKYQ